VIHAARCFRRRPVVSVASVGLLAVGMCTATTLCGALFEIWRPPIACVGRPREVYVLVDPQGRGLSHPAYLDFATSAAAFGTAAAYALDTFAVTVGGEERDLHVAMVTSQYFALFQTTLLIGRTWSRGVPCPGAIISYSLWRDAFRGRWDVVGQPIDILHRRFTVVGVTPRGFRGLGLNSLSLWIPLETAPGRFGTAGFRSSTEDCWLTVLVRLKAGVPVKALEDRMAKSVTTTNDRVRSRCRAVRLTDLRWLHSKQGPVLLLLAALSITLLLASATNVAAVVLMQLQQGTRDAAVRVAPGAGAFRLLTRCVAELGMLMVAGAAVGGVLAHWAAVAFQQPWLPRDMSGWDLMSDASGVPIVVILMFCAMMAATIRTVYGGRPRLTALVSHDCCAVVPSRTGRQAVLAQVAFAFILLIQAAAIGRGLSRWKALNVGFDFQHVVVAVVDWNTAGYTLADVVTLNDRLTAAFGTLPQVHRAAYVYGNPFDLRRPISFERISLSDGRLPGSVDGHTVSYGPIDGPTPLFVSPQYFAAMGTRLLAGRTFGEADRWADTRSVVLSRRMVEFLWPGERTEAVLSRCVVIGTAARCSCVVGVVEDVLYTYAAQSQYVQNTYYLISSQREEAALNVPFTQVAYFVRVRGDLGEGTHRVREVIRRIVPGLPDGCVTVQPAESGILHRRVATWEYMAVGTPYFAAFAFLLALIGLAGHLVQSVLLETRQLTIRMALGARLWDLCIAIGRRSLQLTLRGAVIGTIVSVLMSGPLGEEYQIGVNSPDLLTAVLVGVAIVLVAGAACVVPIHKVANMNAATILRE